VRRWLLAIGVAGVSAAVAACTQVLPQGTAPTGADARRDGRPSWMTPDAPAIKELLYVSDWQTDDVFVYNYENGAIVGRLTGFSRPYGLCVDGPGHVWITNFDGKAVVEYAHGGSKPLRTLQSAGHSSGCSVDPTNGNLAVTNLDLPAELQIYKKASGKPAVYKSSACADDMWSPGYGEKGNLYVEGSNYVTPAVCELARGSSKLRGPIKLLNFTIGLGGGVMWDGTHIALTDQSYNGHAITAIYQVKVTESGSLQEAGTTILKNRKCGGGVRVPQPFVVGRKNTPLNRVQGTTVLGGNVQCLSRFSSWHYPSGAGESAPLQSPPAQPFGQSLSIAP
jgi:hypothetical protein